MTAGIPDGSTPRRADDPTVSVRIRPDLLARLDAACRSRLVGRRLLIETALERLLDGLDQAEDPS